MSKGMTRPWDEILDYYQKLVNAGVPVQSMLTLVARIHSSSYSEGLFAWTSMCNLCIVQTPVNHPNHGPYLRITPLANDRLEFRYLDTEIEANQWYRLVPGEEGFARLESFIEQLHWF